MYAFVFLFHILFAYSHASAVVALLFCADDSVALHPLGDDSEFSVVVEFAEGNSDNSVEHKFNSVIVGIQM